MPKKRKVQSEERKKKINSGELDATALAAQDTERKKRKKRGPKHDAELAAVEVPFQTVATSAQEVIDKIIKVPLDDIYPNPANPNVMSDIEFNALVNRIKTVGFRGVLELRPITDPEDERYNKKRQKYELIGGEHRWEALKVLKWTHAPAMIDDVTDNQDAHDLNLLAANMLHGNLDAEKFTNLWTRLTPKYGEETTMMAAGIMDREVLNEYILEAEKGLDEVDPTGGLKDEFKKKKKNIKTIEDISKVVNELYTKFGSTTENSYLFFMHAGQTHYIIWMTTPTRHVLDEIGDFCKENNLDINYVLQRVLTVGWDKEIAGVALNDARSDGKVPLTDDDDEFEGFDDEAEDDDDADDTEDGGYTDDDPGEEYDDEDDAEDEPEEEPVPKKKPKKTGKQKRR